MKSQNIGAVEKHGYSLVQKVADNPEGFINTNRAINISGNNE
jgi:hypothetical protein